MSNNTKIAIERIKQAKKNKQGYLDLSGLQLSEIPLDISEMYYLFDLDLSYNQLVYYPDSIAELDGLCYLDISHNNLQEIVIKHGRQHSLKEINISHNSFNFIPEDLTLLQPNTKIIYDNNPFLFGLPPELKHQDDLHYIMYYVDALKKVDNRKRLFETKLLFVGKGDVGKTTLMKTLINPSYDFSIGVEKPTHGINIKQFKHPVYFPAQQPFYSNKYFEKLCLIDLIEETHDDNNDETSGKTGIKESYTLISELVQSEIWNEDLIEMRVSNEPNTIISNAYFEKDVKINLWDFGGQELLYGTHQFFLTQRSIYLFVWDSRTDNEEESFDYWLNVIKRLSDNSPVIIVMNKLDFGIKNIDEVSYINKFPNIIKFIKVSCFTKEGISDLLKVIEDTIRVLPQIGDELPKSWDDIRKKLKKVSDNYITYDKFKKICNLPSQENVRFISSYLNDLGDIIHFNNDFALKDLVIINPHWLTKAIYELIHSLEVQKNNGLFNANDLSMFLDENIYPTENYHAILLLMEKFEICFKVIGSNNLYVIPTLLKAVPPDTIEKNQFEIPDSLKYNIQYDFMPSGLIERLICRLKDFLRGSDFWKFGAIFKTELGEAMIVLNKPKKTIDLFVIGSVKSELFSAITQEIKKINKDLKLRIEDYNEKMACNCIHCVSDENPYMIDSNVLLNFIGKGKKSIDCQKSTESANIEELLIGYKSKTLQKSLLRSFVKASSQFQGHKKLIEKYDENEMNSFFKILLSPFLGEDNYANEQSMKGVSEVGKKQGELDISIESKEGISISFYEGLILSSVNIKILNSHIAKSLNQYDPNGLKEKFIGVYCKSKNFSAFCKRYLIHISKKHPNINNVVIKAVEDLSKIYISGSEIKLFRVTYKRSNIELRVYHLLINIYAD